MSWERLGEQLVKQLEAILLNKARKEVEKALSSISGFPLKVEDTGFKKRDGWLRENSDSSKTKNHNHHKNHKLIELKEKDGLWQ